MIIVLSLRRCCSVRKKKKNGPGDFEDATLERGPNSVAQQQLLEHCEP
jgi:hypothetical protein